MVGRQDVEGRPGEHRRRAGALDEVADEVRGAGDAAAIADVEQWALGLGQFGEQPVEGGTGRLGGDARGDDGADAGEVLVHGGRLDPGG